MQTFHEDWAIMELPSFVTKTQHSGKKKQKQELKKPSDGRLGMYYEPCRESGMFAHRYRVRGRSQGEIISLKSWLKMGSMILYTV